MFCDDDCCCCDCCLLVVVPDEPAPLEAAAALAAEAAEADVALDLRDVDGPGEDPDLRLDADLPFPEEVVEEPLPPLLDDDAICWRLLAISCLKFAIVAAGVEALAALLRCEDCILACWAACCACSFLA